MKNQPLLFIDSSNEIIRPPISKLRSPLNHQPPISNQLVTSQSDLYLQSSENIISKIKHILQVKDHLIYCRITTNQEYYGLINSFTNPFITMATPDLVKINITDIRELLIEKIVTSTNQEK